MGVSETEDRYQYIKTMQRKNLIVPLVVDFGEPKTLKTVENTSRTTAQRFRYISNVEDFLDGKWQNYLANLESLPRTREII